MKSQTKWVLWSLISGMVFIVIGFMMKNNRSYGLSGYAPHRTTNLSSQALVTRTIPVLGIPGINGYAETPNNNNISHVTLSLPRNDFSHITTVNFNGKIFLIPAGWTASGAIGSDGSGEFSAYPPGYGSAPRAGFPQLSVTINPGAGLAGYSAIRYFPAFRQTFAQNEGLSSIPSVTPPSWYGITSSTGQFDIPDIITGPDDTIATFQILEPNTGDITDGIVFAPIVSPHFLATHTQTPEEESIIMTLPPGYRSSLATLFLHYDAHALGIPEFR